MEWYEIISLAATITVPIVIAILTERRAIKKLDKHLNFGNDEQSMARQLGVKDISLTAQLGVKNLSLTEQIGIGSKSLTEQIGVGSKSLTEQIGVGLNDKSLTLQHKELCEIISGIRTVIENSQIRQASVNTEAEQIANSMAAFQQAYITTYNENTELKAEIQNLKEILNMYRLQFGEVNNDNNEDESDNEFER